MIEYKTGNLLLEDAEALVNSVNCVGVMGRGIALQFKRAWPDNFRAYAAACRRGEVQPGRMFVFPTNQLDNPKYIINFPTKRHWRSKSRLDDIRTGLEALAQEIRQRKIRSVAVPPLGSGLGGLPWPEVRKCIEQILGTLEDVRIIVFEPTPGRSKATPPARKTPAPRMTSGRAALLRLVQSYLEGALVPFVSLLEVHKLVYFLQESGEPLKLRFAKGVYGPYAENLRHVLQRIEGHFTAGYGEGGDEPYKEIRLCSGAVEKADDFLLRRPETRSRVKRVVELVEGFESPHGMELLATVHWLVQHESVRSSQEVVQRFYAWHERKRRFTERQILLAHRVLSQRGWLGR